MIKLYEEGKTTREIAKIVKISLRDIGIILREYNKEPEPKPVKPDYSKALQLFSAGKTPIQVSIIVDISFETVKRWYFEILELKGMNDFVSVLKNHPNFIPFFTQIAKKMNDEGMFEEDINLLIASLIHDVAIRHRKEQLTHEINCLTLEKLGLENELNRFRGGLE